MAVRAKPQPRRLSRRQARTAAATVGPYNARILGREVEVAYPFHPLFRRSAIVIGDQLHNGTRHLTLRSGEGPSFLVPAWMADPEAASVKIVDAPCLSIARLLDLRAFLDSGLACDLREEFPSKALMAKHRTSTQQDSVRGAAAKHEARGDGAGEGAGAAPSASNGGGGDLADVSEAGDDQDHA